MMWGVSRSGILHPLPAAVAAVAGLLLDSIAPAAAAYSIRQLRAAYAGPCLRVRRSSDNAEQDIYFNTATPPTIDTVALAAFVGSNSGFVSKWYDQSGNGQDAYQTTASIQQTLVNAGANYTQGGYPCLAGPVNVNRAMIIPPAAFAGMSSSTGNCVFSHTSGDNLSGWWTITSSGSSTHSPFSDGNAYEGYLATSRPAFAYAESVTTTVHTVMNTGATMSVFRNGTQAGTTQSITFTNAPSTTSSNSYDSVSLSEVVLTKAVLSTADQHTLERSQGAFFGVTVA